MMESKIGTQHRAKKAYIYLRQSTMGQVRFNQESTERQYALQHKAKQLGWGESAVKILDQDLGISGKESGNREDFKTLVADVSMCKVGAIFALEASRLSRSCTDWHRLLELCALTETLIIDEDGCYNPADFNDQLLLGLKGTMSQAELHFIRARLLGGKKNKAKKGELRMPLPVGFCHDDNGKIVFDSDEQVRKVLCLFFKVFKETGSAYGVVHYFSDHQFQFPKRAYGGIWKGRLIWGTLSTTRVLGILKNPVYAGAYVYGRYKYQKSLSEEGNIQTKTIVLPMEQWEVLLQDHHEGYISWDEYLKNQAILQSNCTHTQSTLPGPVREGLSLLQGLLICKHCGRRLTVRYMGNKGIYPLYECTWKKREGLSRHLCLSIPCKLIDQAVSKRALEIMEPAQIQIAIDALKELESRIFESEKQWEMKIERAKYEAQLAQRRYEEVDPANRLVAATLEERWNQALEVLTEQQSQFAEHQKKNKLMTFSEQKEDLLILAKDLPRLWNSPSTNPKDRKRILRLLIKDVTVERSEKTVIAYIRWQGGKTERLKMQMPEKSYEKWKHSQETIDRVRDLAKEMPDKEIAERFNQEGMKTNKENPYTASIIQWIRYKHKISPWDGRKNGELSVNQVARKFSVSHHVVRYWTKHEVIPFRRQGSRLWLSIDEKKELELKQIIQQSKKIAKARGKKSKTQKKPEGGVL